MNSKNLRESTAFKWVSRLAFATFILVFLSEYKLHLAVIRQHLRTSEYSLEKMVSPQQETVRRAEERLKEIKDMELSPSHAIAYFGDDKFENQADFAREYFLARYTLAPLMIKINEPHDTAIFDLPLTSNFNLAVIQKEAGAQWKIIAGRKDAFLVVKKKDH